MRPAIRVDNLSKRYRVSQASSHRYRTFRESICETAAKPIRSLRSRLGRAGSNAATRDRATTDDEFWALKDVSFEVKPGEVLGVVGRNGAGKSTLLKIISRITPPTHGEIEMRGRVGSLLEVGTGFHPELTGRENIFLNGAILGMTRSEIRRRFDEIVAFAEVERFLDTPVKRYSSGMYTRLAFAVASHLEPEIMIVDEVLAVGDAQFQKKCLGRMGEVSRAGRTILFVSHNMSAIKSLCTRGILIEGGQITHDGTTDEVVNRYLAAGSGMARTGVIPDNAPRYSDVKNEARVSRVRLADRAGNDVNQLYFGQPFRIEVTCDVLREIDDPQIEISISTLDGTQVACSFNTDGGVSPVPLAPGRHQFSADFDLVPLPREYTIDVGIHHGGNGLTADYVQRTLDFTVLRVAESGGDHYPWPRTRGLVRAPARWKLPSSNEGAALEVVR
jgi:lipopolysaccharide transport system ATP-binding protein